MLQWKILMKNGQVFRGEEEASGELHVTADLPLGELLSVKAAMPVVLSDEGRIFMNGYQTWTFCPEYTKTDYTKGIRHLPSLLVQKYHLDRYGDYHFVKYPHQKGITHGFSWCYFREGSQYRLIASLDEKPGYTMFRYDAGKGLLIIKRDCRNMICGGEFHAFDLFIAQGTEEEVFDGWFRALGVKARTKEKIAGYSSWYNRYQNIDEKSIEEDLRGAAGVLPEGSFFQIDDGWERYVGDWIGTDPRKFPHGLAPVVKEIHEKGFRAGLWLAPFVAEKKSALFREHPDWFYLHKGEPWCDGCNWSGFYSLDIDNSEVIDYLQDTFDQVFQEWGFDLVKLDFLYGAAPFGSRTESRAARMIRAMELLRELCGDKLILGCGVPVMPAFGLVDYCRVSCDVGLDWDDSPLMQKIHRERVSTRQAILNTFYRRQLDGRAYGNDPDVFFIRENNLDLTPGQKRMLAVNGLLFGSVAFTSDNMLEYSDDRKETWHRLLELRDARDIRIRYKDGKAGVLYNIHNVEHELILP
ncbi:MAG: alpha-galactosidase [Blautia sp.]|nr:alpha-galactosidase [Blautia sp.]